MDYSEYKYTYQLPCFMETSETKFYKGDLFQIHSYGRNNNFGFFKRITDGKILPTQYNELIKIKENVRIGKKIQS